MRVERNWKLEIGSYWPWESIKTGIILQWNVEELVIMHGSIGGSSS